jgi:cytochrome c
MARPGRGYDPLAPRAAPRPPDADVELDAEHGNLPAGEGADLVFYLCSGCHSLGIVKQQRLTDARWAYTLGWMVAEQGMAELDPETEAAVLDYLTTHFSGER